MEFTLLNTSDLKALIDKVESLEKGLGRTARKEERYYSIKELMELLGVSRKTVQAWRDKRLIAFSQVGRNIWFSRSAIEAFMLRNRYRSRFQTKI